MDESYRIEVLHIVNPHVIFIESHTQEKEILIEQVGIFGVLPVNQTVDIDGKVVFEKCENWPVSVNNVITEFLEQYKDRRVSFVPLQIDRRSSIFNDSVHKFGDICVKVHGKKKYLSKHLEQMTVAYKDEVIFHQKLSSGHIRTKLNSVRSEQVLNEIKKFYRKQKATTWNWQDAIDKKTSLHRESKQLSNMLTTKNLELFNKNADSMVENVLEIIDQKVRDLNLCKDIDEVSLGRATRRIRPNMTPPPNSEVPYEDNKQSPYNILMSTKQCLETHGTVKDANAKHFVHKVHKHRKKEHKTSAESERKIDENRQIKEIEFNQKYFKENLGRPQDYKYQEYFKNIPEDNTHNVGSAQLVEDTVSDLKPQVSTKSPKRLLEPNERWVAYGPPMEMAGSNLQKLKIFKINSDEHTHYRKTSPKEEEIEEPSKLDDYDRADSHVDFKISNLDSHKKISPHKSLDETNVNTSQFDDEKARSKTVNSSNLNSENQGSKQFSNNNSVDSDKRLKSALLRRRLQTQRDVQRMEINNSMSSNSDTSAKDSSSGKEICQEDEEIAQIKEKLKAEYKPLKLEIVNPKFAQNVHKVERNVNPFKNLDGSKSVFVDKLVSPILMVHTKNDNLILPQSNLRDVPFKTDIHCMLKNMQVKEPNRLQSVSWTYILRGHSVFMISPAGSGKTLGYIPAVCNLVRDSINDIQSVGPICVIVCATAKSVTDVEENCKRFLGLKERVLACFPGIDTVTLTTALLNGCDILVCTAPMLYRLLGADFGADLRRLTTLVFEDCERLSQVYALEIKVILHHVKDMLKNRVDKYLKVQYIVASRHWCNFLTPLARNAPNTIITIAAFQECVLYSKTNTSVNFVLKFNKINAVLEFLKDIDSTKKTVIVCRSDDEVTALETTLTKQKYTVFACNSEMTLHDLYNLNIAWGNYEEPVIGPILICCDGNLTHLNVTNANYLVHFSMPAMFSTFCKRYAVLNDNYASIFAPQNDKVRIKILLEENNVEQLPKILHFVKRWTKEVPPRLDDIARQVLEQKDLDKGEKLVPICDSLLTLGECADPWNCQERHAILKQFDEPKDWMPKRGVITFKITHYDSAVTYSARLLANMVKGRTTKFANNYNTLLLKMGMYFSKESNRKLHGIPKLGDICAVAVKQNFYARCQVMKILSCNKQGQPHQLLINLIDEEQLDVTRDVYLYHLPDEFKSVETHIVKVRLANIQPQDKDVTYSVLAKEQLKKIADNDENLYLRGQVVMTIGNCIFVDTLEACQDLSSLGETVVKHDLKKKLLSRHAEPNPKHIEKLKKLSGLVVLSEEPKIQDSLPATIQRSAKWAHLDKDDFSTVIFTSAIDAGRFFVRLAKYQNVVYLLLIDIKKYIETQDAEPVGDIYVGKIVLAEFPDDCTYERARIDEVIDNDKVKCFFVDNGDWRDVLVKNLRSIPQKFLARVPFQAIECRLIGVKPPNDDWTEFSTNWLCDNCFEDNIGNTKYLFAKYYTKEKATMTEGHKYGVVLVDTTGDNEVVINKQMMELNLAREDELEAKYLDEPLSTKPLKPKDSSSDEEDITDKEKSFTKETSVEKSLVPILTKEVSFKSDSNESNDVPLRNIFFEKPIRSVPLVSDSDSEDSDKWDVNLNRDILGMFEPVKNTNITDYKSDKDSADNETNTKVNKPMVADSDNVITNDASYSKTAELSNNLSQIETCEDPSQVTPNSTMTVAESQSDDNSDVYGICKDRIDAFTMFKQKLKITEEPNRDLNLVTNKVELKSSINDTKKVTESVNKSVKNDLDSDDLSSVTSPSLIEEIETIKMVTITEITAPPRKPKLIWRQNKNSVTLKIQLIGVEDYTLLITEKHIKFLTYTNETNYEFDFELYGVINPKKSSHSNKGQYILVNLIKILQRNWLNLTNGFTVQKWISYDVDSIHVSSDEETEMGNDALKVLKERHEKEETESEDDDFVDDANFRYKRNLDVE